MPGLMVVGAHHDDCEWKAGGLTLLLKDLGWDTRFVVVTTTASPMGDPDDVAENVALQKQKALRSADILGVEKVFLGFPSMDDRVSATEVTSRLADEIAEFGPDALVCDWPRDSHPDHRLSGSCAVRAWKRPSLGTRSRDREISEVLCYTAYTYGDPPPTDFVVDITEHWDRLCRALKSFPEFENPRGNNLILTKERFHVDKTTGLYWEQVEGFHLLKGHPERVTVLVELLAGKFRWLPKVPPRELVF